MCHRSQFSCVLYSHCHFQPHYSPVVQQQPFADGNTEAQSSDSLKATQMKWDSRTDSAGYAPYHGASRSAWPAALVPTRKRY